MSLFLIGYALLASLALLLFWACCRVSSGTQRCWDCGAPCPTDICDTCLEARR